ncbi:MAG: hypothetical protein LBV59_05765 [Sphingobacterium sp.]|jgi:hypothetical protein|uniref:hypothetical protein n=1 Tax=unclassified Sphingobacterium TaxID=2609468 RepID=UPI00284DCCF8|nr:hypothetical protein [Sphingobacterium sp.]MDR3007421.1 hypothetical protein [Sphingobacterium sp.]
MNSTNIEMKTAILGGMSDYLRFHPMAIQPIAEVDRLRSVIGKGVWYVNERGLATSFTG